MRVAPRRRPHPLRGPRPGSCAPVASRGADGTAGQQRLLQVSGASAAAAPHGLLRWNRLAPHPRALPSCTRGSTRCKSPSPSGADRPERSESAGPCSYSLDPSAPLPAGHRPRMPRSRSRPSQLIIPYGSNSSGQDWQIRESHSAPSPASSWIVNSTFLGETYEHGAGHEKPTLVVVPSAVKAFSWLFPTPRPGAGQRKTPKCISVYQMPEVKSLLHPL
ncbi:hypothetical protein MM560_G142n15 [Manis javanica]|nr:hypothetical protein MM560_G142n15 [Manis javanica]